MKKLALFILSFAFALSSSQSFAAKSSLIDPEELKWEKLYVLAMTVSDGAENEVDEEMPFQILAPNRRTFYFNDENCGSSRHCLLMKNEFDKFSLEFARDYNQVIEENNLSDDLKIEIVSTPEEAAITIYLTDLYGVKSYSVRCPDSEDINYHTDDGCDTLMNYEARHPRNMIHYYLLEYASLGFTKQKPYSDCTSFGYASTKEDAILCELEKKAIVFVHRYLEPGMKKAEVEKLFDKHWLEIELQ